MPKPTNVSVVINYEGHNAGDSAGYVQLTRSADRVFVVVDGRPVGNMNASEFTEATSRLVEAGS